MRVGDALELEILRLADAGRAVAQAPDGRVIFVRGCGPGDRIEATITRLKKRWAEARITRRIAPGPHAVEPFCPHFEACGGCPWQGVDLATQRAALVAHVERLVERACGGPVPVTCEGVEPTRAWRSTARLHWDAGRLGYHPPGSHAVIDLDACPILAPPLPALLRAVRTHLDLAGQGTLRLTAAPGAASGTVTLTPAGPIDRALRAGARRLLTDPSCHGIRLGHLTLGEPVDRLGPQAVPHPAGAFVQAHQPGSARLVAAAVEACGPPGAILELFAGSGNFSLALAAAGHRVTTVEIDAAAARALAAEAERRGLSVDARVGDAAALPPDVPTIALIDPPRAGAAAAVAALHAAGVARIVYVACGPAAMARDVAWLVERGWRLGPVRLFDLFPHTGHVEALAVLERAP